MGRPDDPLETLRTVIGDGRAVVVAGTGVSIAATEAQPQASWAGLLENGLEWLRERDLIIEETAQAHLSLMRSSSAQTHHFVSAAQDIVTQMGGSDSTHFRRWLEQTVGALTIRDRDGLDALHALRAHGNLLATTNYDSLLLADDTLTPVTWSQHDEVLAAARHSQTDKVIHLHGHWRRPDTVVLDWSSYDRITRDERHRADLDAFWHLSTWVYVGCGINGLTDPDLGLLVERYGGRLRTAGLWDLCLVLRSQQAGFQAFFDANEMNILAVSFGNAHDELPGFLHSLLPALTASAPPAAPQTPPTAGPTPPELCAVPDYLGSHEFVGREAQLRDLDDWARPADPTNLLLFEAIGGGGKSMLTWRWVNDHAPVVRGDWAGRFWYSFYERGAVMADFCRRALTYMTGQPPETFARQRTRDLVPILMDQLHDRPWLLVLDGLERVLVAYHRIDAAEILDEAIDDATDTVLERKPTATIRDEDGDLLRRLAGARPSKVLVTSRLTPQVLLNPAGQAIPGAKRQSLGGLRPADAEAMFRASGGRGDPERIQRYLTENCDNHPLVVGVVAGLVAHYFPDRGNFDVWADDDGPAGGGRLDLADLDLVQRRNHILWAALSDLAEPSRDLLSTLALLPEAIDHETLVALNPFLPPLPPEVDEPAAPMRNLARQLRGEQRELLMKEREKRLARYAEQVREREELLRRRDEGGEGATATLAEAVRDLEQRGLLQYDAVSRRHDLHPVVRGVASGRIAPDDLERHGQRLVDHFTVAPHPPYEGASGLEDVAPAINLVRTLLKLGRVEEAAHVYVRDLSAPLDFNLEAYSEMLALVRPFFGRDWTALPDRALPYADALSTDAAIALAQTQNLEIAWAIEQAILVAQLEDDSRWVVSTTLLRLAGHMTGRPASVLRLKTLALDVAVAEGDDTDIFGCLLALYATQIDLGRWDDADTTWSRLDPMGRDWRRKAYVPGRAELLYAHAQYGKGTLREEHLVAVELLAASGHNRVALRSVHGLRGEWHMEQGDWSRAAESFTDAVRMARERGLACPHEETGLVLAKVHLGHLSAEEGRLEAARLSRHPFVLVAKLWQALGDEQAAGAAALRAYESAWAQGEPFVFRTALTRAEGLLADLGLAAPDLAPYDPAADEPFAWEADVHVLIDRVREEMDELLGDPGRLPDDGPSPSGGTRGRP